MLMSGWSMYVSSEGTNTTSLAVKLKHVFERFANPVYCKMSLLFGVKVWRPKTNSKPAAAKSFSQRSVRGLDSRRKNTQTLYSEVFA